MRTSAVAGVGLVIGFVFGLMLDVVIGVAGMVSGGEPGGVRFLPLGTAVLGAVAAAALYQLRRHKSR